MKNAIPIQASNTTSIWRMKKIIYNESILPNDTVKIPASTVTRDFWGGKGIFIWRKRLQIRSPWIINCCQLYSDTWLDPKYPNLSGDSFFVCLGIPETTSQGLMRP